MEILVNGKPLEAVLENEKTLGDVIRGIETWLKNSDLVITSVLLDERELYIEKTDEWKNILIDTIKSVSFTVKPLNEVQVSYMENILRYLSMLKKAVDEKDGGLLADLNEGHPFMIESLLFILERFLSESLRNKIDTLRTFFPNLDEKVLFAWPGSKKEEAFRVLDDLSSALCEIIEETSEPLKALASLALKLKTLIREISDVSILLQTGKDREAMGVLVSFSDTLQKFLRVFLLLKKNADIHLERFTISEMSFEDYYNKLNTLLKELIDAFRINDSVLIGDLLEYEIAPRMEGLIKFIEGLKELDASVPG